MIIFLKRDYTYVEYIYFTQPWLREYINVKHYIKYCLDPNLEHFVKANRIAHRDSFASSTSIL